MKNLNLNEMQATQGGGTFDRWDCTASDGDGIALGWVNFTNYAQYDQLFHNLAAADKTGTIPSFAEYLADNCIYYPETTNDGPITIMI